MKKRMRMHTGAHVKPDTNEEYPDIRRGMATQHNEYRRNLR